MTLDLLPDLDRLSTGDIADWPGLAARTSVGSAGLALGFEPDLEHEGSIGDPARPASFALGHSDRYAGRIRLWTTTDDGLAFAERDVQVVEARHPRSRDGDLVVAPDLGPPEATLPARLGLIDFEDGELVYASRGLAIRINPENGVLLGVVGFEPTTVADYLANLRPFDSAPHPQPAGASR